MHATARRAGGVLAAALTTLALATASTPASADTERSRDDRGDTRTEDGRNPGQRTADVVRFDSHHGRQRVAFRFVMADVDPRAELYVTASMRTSDRRAFRLQLVKVEGEPGRRLRFMTGDGSDGSVREARCPGASGSVRPRARSVWMSVPRSCLGDPRWVRTGGFVESRPPQGSVFDDDARRDGGTDEYDVEIGQRRLSRG